MDIHAFSGFSSKDMVATRTAGILAVLTEAYPEMTWDDVLAWAHENDLDDWVPNLDTDDDQPNSVRLVGGDGFINFDDRYPWPANGQSLFNDWKKNYEIGKLPPIETASPAIQEVFTPPTLPSQPAPSYQPEYYDAALTDEWNSPATSEPPPGAPTNYAPPAAPAYTPPPAAPQYSQSPTATPAPAMPAPKPTPKPSSAPAGGSSNMLLIVGGLLAAYMLMKRKK